MAKYKAREIGRAYKVEKESQWGLWLFWGVVVLFIIGAAAG